MKTQTLNTTRLRILREVAARGTIAAAAEALYLTPPAASHQLAVLEREVGVPLLDRTARSVKLTDAGLRLVEQAETIALPAMVALRDRYPALDVTAAEFEPVRAIPALKSGQLDIALSHEWDFVPPEKEPGLDRVILLSEPVVVLLPRGHRLAGAP